METATTLASGLDYDRKKAACDAACKRLLSEKIILGWILRSCLAEFQGCDAREIAEKYIEGDPLVSAVPLELGADQAEQVELDRPDASGAEPHSGDRIRGRGQEYSEQGSVFFDICFDALVPGAENTEETVQLIINVEAQNKFYPGYPLLKRGIFYGGRLLSAQDGTVFAKSHYEKLRKVYSIWICMKPPQGWENTITRYHMTEENLVGSVRADVRNYDLLTVVMVCLGPPDRVEEDRTLKLLGTLFSTELPTVEKKRILEGEFHLPMTQTVEKEVSLMCNLSEGFWEAGMEKGMEKGIGIGIEKTRVESLQSLMQELGITLDRAMSLLHIPAEERSKYAALIQ